MDAVKPKLGWPELSGMEMVAKQIDELPDGSPEKEAMKARFKDAHDQILEKYDSQGLIDNTPGRFSKPLHLIDYGSGLLRTAVGETGLAAKAAWDKAMGKPSSYSAGSAVARGIQAVNPWDKPALGMENYLDLGGAGDMGSIQDAEGGYKLTGKKALGFAGDMALNPSFLKKGLESILGSGAESLAERPPITADVMREAEQTAKDSSAREMSPGIMPAVKALPGQVANVATDPVGALRDALLRMRFRNADNAVEMAGTGGGIVKRPKPSQIFQESGGKGITSEQIRQDARAIVNRNSDQIDHMTNDVAGISSDGIYRGVPSEIAANPNMHARTAMHPLYTPEQQLAERTPFTAKDAQGARAQIEDEFRTAAQGNPQLMSLVGQQVERAGVPETVDGQMPLWKTPPELVTRSTPEVNLMTDDGFIRASRPAKTVQSYEGGEAAVAPPASSDPLSVDEPYSLPQVSTMASAAQGKAATRKFFLSRDRFAPDAPQTPPASREALAAEGGLYAQQGAHLRGLQEDILDEARPGLGGDAHQINQRTSSLLEGMPYIDRPKPTPAAGRPTARSRSAFGGYPMMAIDAATSAGKTGAMAGYQALSNPVVRGMAPAARAMWLENYWKNQYQPTTDESGMPAGDNPWALIHKYGDQR